MRREFEYGSAGNWNRSAQDRFAPQREDRLRPFHQDGENYHRGSRDEEGAREVQASDRKVEEVLCARRAEHRSHRRRSAHRRNASAVEAEALALSGGYSTSRDRSGRREAGAGELGAATGRWLPAIG